MNDSVQRIFPKILLMKQQFIQSISDNLRETDCKKSSEWLLFHENIGSKTLAFLVSQTNVMKKSK